MMQRVAVMWLYVVVRPQDVALSSAYTALLHDISAGAGVLARPPHPRHTHRKPAFRGGGPQ